MMRIRIKTKAQPVLRKGDRVALRWEPAVAGTIVEVGEEVSGMVFDEQPDKFTRYFANKHFCTPASSRVRIRSR